MSPSNPYARKYLDLLKEALSASLYDESAWKRVTPKSPLRRAITRMVERRSMLLLHKVRFDPVARERGSDWPMFGFTMAGTKRLENIEACIAGVTNDGVAGDFVECGVWRGGSSIFARAALDAYGASDRIVWLADSFEGMPERKETDLADPELIGTEYLAVSLEQVKANFDRFQMLDDRVRFVKGWFADTLQDAPIGPVAILRLDGDYYSSTMDALEALYNRVSVGGYVIIDDYNAFESCKAAVTDFAKSRNFTPNLVPIDDIAVFWRRET